MLTSRDLTAIGELLDAKLNSKLAPIQKDIRELKRTTKKLGNDLQMVLGNLDERELKLRKRVDRIESHMGIS